MEGGTEGKKGKMLQLNYKLKQKQDKQETTLITRTGHMAQWLRTISTLNEGQVHFPVPGSNALSGLCGYPTNTTYGCTHTTPPQKNLKIIFQYKEQNSILKRFEENFEFGVSNFKDVWFNRINCVDKKKICPLRYE